MDRWVIGAVAVAAACCIAVPAGATEPQTVLEDVAAAVAAEDAAPGLAAVGITKRDGNAVTVTPGVQLAVPAGNVTAGDNGTIVSGRGSHEIAFQQVADHEFRAAVRIDSPAAPERYRFDVRGASRLAERTDGGVNIFDRDGQRVASIEPAWARDHAGRVVPTRFEIDGTTLVQVVEHHGRGFEYGIVADPHIKWHLMVWELQFSKAETLAIAEISAYTAGPAIMAMVPLWAKPVVGLAVLAIHTGAKEAKKQGLCVSVWPGPVITTRHC